MATRPDGYKTGRGVSGKWTNYLTDNETKIQSATVILTYHCNLFCSHCGVDSGPNRKESMSPEFVKKVVDEVARAEIPFLVLSGGEVTTVPELLMDTLRYAKEKHIDSIVQTNGAFATGKDETEIRTFFEELKTNGAKGIEIASDDVYHGEIRKNAGTAARIAGDVFGKSNVNTFGASGPIVPIGRAKKMLDDYRRLRVDEKTIEAQFTVGKNSTYCTDTFNMYHKLRIDANGDVYNCACSSVKMGNVNDMHLPDIIKKARSYDSIAKKIADKNGFAKLDPERDIHIDKEEFNALVDELGECGACYEFFRIRSSKEQANDILTQEPAAED